jgi:hypothetical protein
VPGWAFRDNNQVGALVRRITARSEALAQLYLAKDPPRQQQALQGLQGLPQQELQQPAGVQQQQQQQQPQGGNAGGGGSSSSGGGSGGGSGGARVCFVDGAVYSKNRHFRLLGSCKGGKRAVLQPTQRYAMSAAARWVKMGAGYAAG